MRKLVLYFSLLLLGVLFNFIPDVVCKYSRFSKTFFEKNLKFVPSKGKSLVICNLSLMLLLAKVNPILEEKGCKRDAFMTLDSSDFEIVLVLPTEIIIFYIEVAKI